MFSPLVPAILLSMLLTPVAPEEPPRGDPNAPAESPAPPARRPLGFKVFNNMDSPITGLWDLEIPQMHTRRLELKELDPTRPGTLVGIDRETSAEVLRLNRKKQGIGFEGQLTKLFDACGFDTLPVSEFLPLGDAIVLRFLARPPEAPCPAIDGGKAGTFQAIAPRGGMVRLRDMSEISSSNVRESYSIGGDRPSAQVTTEIPLGAVSVDSGSEVHFLKRVKAPLDSSYWFEVEAVVSPEAGVSPPRGFLKAESLLFTGSLTLRRVKEESRPPAPP
jgi:hypothetical protein